MTFVLLALVNYQSSADFAKQRKKKDESNLTQIEIDFSMILD